jgi:Flp pilus assembly protein CpaB
VLARAQVTSRVGLAADQVAMTIPARPDSAVDGRLRPGDTVQVLVTVIDKTRNEAHTRQILDRALVFEVGRDQSFGSSSATVEPDRSTRGSISSVTLAITADQARQLAEARRTGELDVLLLPPPEVVRP